MSARIAKPPDLFAQADEATCRECKYWTKSEGRAGQAGVVESGALPAGAEKLAAGAAQRSGVPLLRPGAEAASSRAFVERYLRTVRPECDQPESPDDDAEVRIGRGLKYPKDKGYGKFLETLGYDRNWAGMMAASIVEEGRVRAATAKGSTEFAQALRRLANPRLETEAFLANAKVALEAMSGTELRSLFERAPEVRGASVHSCAQIVPRWRSVLPTSRLPDCEDHLATALRFRAVRAHPCFCRA